MTALLIRATVHNYKMRPRALDVAMERVYTFTFGNEAASFWNMLITWAGKSAKNDDFLRNKSTLVHRIILQKLIFFLQD